MKKKKQKIVPKQRTSTRKHTLAVMLNDEEMKALNRYLEKYKVKNKSRFVRETLMTAILKKFDEDHPTLF